MKAGDLLKHKQNNRTAIIIDIFIRESHELEYRHEEYAKVLFSGECGVTRAPLKILKDNWEVINEV
tara:strand:+ start:10949 stop:11146 length:198 start_codon:yes stop_codon:yes gene_type:complete